MTNKIYFSDNLYVLKMLPEESVDLIYIDPPFNTGKERTLRRISAAQDNVGDRNGFGGKRYSTKQISSVSYSDSFSDYRAFLMPRLQLAKDLLTATGSLFFHIGWRNSHHCRLLLDEIFGENCCQNEIVWSYDYGGRPKNKWPCKHDLILWYTKHPKKYVFNYECVERIPYMAPKMVGVDKAAQGKTLTDSWWHTIVPTNGKERTDYPTQKPLGVLRRIVEVHSHPGDVLLDFFAGSGSFGEAAGMLGRQFILADSNLDAVRIMAGRLRKYKPVLVQRGRAFNKKKFVRVDSFSLEEPHDKTVQCTRR